MSFKFWAYGILAICALCLTLVLPAVKMGETGWATSFFNFALVIGIAFIAYMFAKLLMRYGLD